ncbi:hypothetical protein BO70DRAFT_360621 [Aspergillus heteromorphus CBS 117.55]|uniref:Uncharacterized protein n=1 Tax=Aspergillus heteromorphus CBS 117.55 TaxID=1448321 RepID=A0A317WRU8_9EURO|nr:uncharacterized protein BO70DRAFT_360621 [Aspergillus heteromorphus CBS 117.55]PWY86900.1 hypothetical protein BO70DRAFT_360621 [Aspergillus heteromorphus CBS 117.55]
MARNHRARETKTPRSQSQKPAAKARRPRFDWNLLEDCVMLHSIVKRLCSGDSPSLNTFRELEDDLGKDFYSFETLRRRWFRVEDRCESVLQDRQNWPPRRRWDSDERGSLEWDNDIEDKEDYPTPESSSTYRGDYSPATDNSPTPIRGRFSDQRGRNDRDRSASPSRAHPRHGRQQASAPTRSLPGRSVSRRAPVTRAPAPDRRQAHTVSRTATASRGPARQPTSGANQSPMVLRDCRQRRRVRQYEESLSPVEAGLSRR